MNTNSAQLLQLKRFRRLLRVRIDQNECELKYIGDGVGYEAIEIDGREVVRKSGLSMVPNFDFTILGHRGRIEIETGLGMNLFGPLWFGHLRRFQLFVDGNLLYEDRGGRVVID